jgi:hypothetical protein
MRSKEMDRYLPFSKKNISREIACEECHENWHVELRRYQDTENIDDYGTLAIVETSVRTACACTLEVDVYADWNRKGKPEVIDVSRGRPTLQPVIEFPVSKPRTNIDDLLDYDKTS